MSEKRKFAPASETGARRPTILVVEDEILVRMAAAEHLRSAGYTVLEAADAAEALRLVSAGNPIDLVFSDVHMPGAMDGDALREWILHERPAIRVLMTTGTEATSGGNGTHRRHVIGKPYALSDLERIIRQLLA